MKLLICLLLLSPLAWSNGNHSENSHGHDSSYNPVDSSVVTATGGSSTSNTIVIVPASSGGGVGSAADSQRGSISGDTILSLNNQLEAVSASAASIRLSFCTSGAAAQSKRGGFSVGGSSYICEIQTTMGLIIVNISKNIADGDTVAAKRAFKRLDALEDQAYEYMQERSKTAPIGAWLRDIWPVFLLLLI